ncbi:MAG: DUF3604 domain-containing protein [Kiritimatiellae bacterium]|nr:DUF3604 domain-containing protein [Kiritimatiellia bacterium]
MQQDRQIENVEYPFFGPDGRRAIHGEIVHAIEQAVGATPVDGFAQPVDLGEARPAGLRISGFAEMWARKEWLLGLSAKKGLSWHTAPVPAGAGARVAFVLNIGFGNGSPLPQPSGRWDLFVNDRPALAVRTVNHSQLWRGPECALAFAANRIETAEPFGSLCLSSLIPAESSAAFGPALLVVPTAWLEPGRRAVIRAQSVAGPESARWVQFAPANSLFEVADLWAAVRLLQQPSPAAGGLRVFFGDIHTHSGQVMDECADKGCGLGSRAENYAFARGAGALDFYALTEHEWQIDPHKTAEYLALADAHNEDGRFVCLPGYEFTNNLYGHRNVYFRASGGAVLDANAEGGRPTLDPAKCRTPQQLWAAMEQTGVPFMTVPHHPSAVTHPLNLAFHNPTYDRLYEVYSCWGSSEYYGDFPRGVSDRYRNQDFQDAVRRGQRYGLIASSDGHDGHPGAAQSPLGKLHQLFHFCGSGRAAVLAPELTREAVFDALYARRCYATTGTPILLDVRVNGALMGTELPALPAGAAPQLSVVCRGTNGLDHIRIVRNAEIAHTHGCHGKHDCRLEWEDTAYGPGTPTSYYVRVVQKDRESAWSSPVWVG